MHKQDAKAACTDQCFWPDLSDTFEGVAVMQEGLPLLFIISQASQSLCVRQESDLTIANVPSVEVSASNAQTVCYSAKVLHDM